MYPNHVFNVHVFSDHLFNMVVLVTDTLTISKDILLYEV